MSTDVTVVLSTFPSADVAKGITRSLLEEQLIACANIMAPMLSVYRWQGEVCEEPEVLVVMKTQPSRVEALTERVISLHPYDCPEVLTLPATSTNPAYSKWLQESCEALT